MESGEPPVLELSQEIPRADTLRQVQLSLPVEAQDVLKYPWGTVKEELSRSQGVKVTEIKDLTWKYELWP